MSGILKSKKTALVGAGIVLAAGTLFALRSEIFPKREKPLTEKSETRIPAHQTLGASGSPGNEKFDWGTENPPTEEPRVSSNASIPKDTLSSLRKAMASLGEWKAKSRSKDKNQEPDKAAKKEISNKIKALRKEISPILRDSEVARKELLETIKNEDDPFVKKELARMFNVTDDKSRYALSSELTQSSSPENQKVGIEMLSNVHTNEALNSLSEMAESRSLDVEVRADAVMGIARSTAFAADDEKFQLQGRKALIELTDTRNEPEIRDKAYRAIAMQPNLTAEDEKMLTQAAEQESDPKVKRMAEFTLKVIEARQKSAQR